MNDVELYASERSDRIDRDLGNIVDAALLIQNLYIKGLDLYELC